MFYPNNIKKDYQRNISHSNRGMDLESAINSSNSYYLDKDIAVIYKKPTPIGIVDVKYTNKSKIIDKAYFKMPSTLDYNGIYKGKYIEFEAKETKLKTSFPLSNIHEHQFNHLKKIIKHGGIAFFIIKMNDLIFLVEGIKLIEYIDNNKRKSIPFKYFLTDGHIIKERINPHLDYLKIIDNIYFKENENEKEKKNF